MGAGGFSLSLFQPSENLLISRNTCADTIKSRESPPPIYEEVILRSSTITPTPISPSSSSRYKLYFKCF